MVGLGSVENTSDADKPVSTRTQSALDDKQNALSSSTDVTVGTKSSTGYLAVTGTSGIPQAPTEQVFL